MTSLKISRAIVLLCLFLFAVTAFSQTILVPSDAVYQYFDQGSEPANDASDNVWYSKEYDGSWSSFEGPLGYGAGDHNEVLNASANAVYFRHEFEIESTEDFDLMFFNLYHNDGTVVYLNGTKVWNVNMPGGDVTYETNASSNVGVVDTAYFALPHLLIDGTNTVAIEVHNSADQEDNTLSLNFELIEYHEVCQFAGNACNDNDPNTASDTINDDCECEGIVCDMEIVVSETQEIYEGQSVILEASGGDEYFWSTGETGSQIEVTPGMTTGFLVTVIDEHGCEDDAEIWVNIIECDAVASAGNDVSLQTGQTVTLTASEGEAYMWSTGELTASIEVSPTETTNYIVTITDSNGCYAKDDVNVIVGECVIGSPCDDGRANTYGDIIDINCDCSGFECAMDVEIAGDNQILIGQSTTLVAEGGEVYEWNNGMTGPIIEVSPIVSTNYSVVIFDQNGCGDVGSFLVTVLDCELNATCDDGNINTYNDSMNDSCECIGLPCHMDVEITGDYIIRPGESATVVADGGLEYIWDNGMTGPVIDVSPEATTTYAVTIVGDNGCEEFASFTVKVIDDFDLDISGGAKIDLGETAVLFASGADTYVWSNGMVGSEITVQPIETTEYTVEATKGDVVKYASATVYVNVPIEDDFDLDVAGGAIIYKGQTTTLSAFGADSYVWSNEMEGSEIKVAPETTTEYTVEATKGDKVKFASVTVTVRDCSLEDVGQICDDGNENTVNDMIIEDCICAGVECNMEVNAETVYSVNDGESVLLSVSGGNHYEWSTGGIDSWVRVTPGKSTTYEVTVFESEYCFEVVVISVEVIHDTGCDHVGIPCDDGNENTVGDEINEECVCAGVECNIEVNAETEYSISVGESVLLLVSGGNHYEWSTGGIDSWVRVAPDESTTYEVTIFETEYCFEVVEIYVEVNQDTMCPDEGLPCDDGNENTVGDVTNENCVCAGFQCNVQVTGLDFYSIVEGQSVVLTVGGGEYYEWSNGETTPSIEVGPESGTTYEVAVFENDYCFEIFEIFVEVNEDPCTLNLPCDDNDPLTTNDKINDNCECVGEIIVEEGNGNGKGSVANEETSTTDLEVPDCTPITSFFPRTKLKHYGSEFSMTSLEFVNIQVGLSFTIEGISQKEGATDSDNYVDVVDVSYVNNFGQEISYGTYDGRKVNDVKIEIDDYVQEIIVKLSDGLDGFAPKIDVKLGNISTCSTVINASEEGSQGLATTQSQLIEASLVSNLTNGRLILEIDNPNESAQDILVSVVDASGIPVLPSAVSGNVLPGVQSEYIDISTLKPGMYYLKVQVGRQLITLKFVVSEYN